jgi:adenylate cyclase
MKLPSLFTRDRMRGNVFLAVALAATGIGLALYFTDPLHEIELKTIDTRFQIRGEHRAPSDLVVVAVDEATLSALDNRFQWPYPRAAEAQLLNNIMREKPKAVAFDIQFSEKSTLGLRDDEALALALLNSKHKVVLANDNFDSKGNFIEFGTNGKKILSEVGATAGDADFPNDTDGVIRRDYVSVPNYDGFDVATAAVATGHKIHVPSAATAWIDFYGPPGTTPTVSYDQVYRGKIDTYYQTVNGQVVHKRAPPDFLHNKIVIIGATEGTLQDVHETAVSRGVLMSGPEIHAQAVSTILAGFPLSHVSTGVDVVLLILMGALVPLTSIKLSFKASVPVMVLVAVALTVGTQIAFNEGHIVTFVYPVIALMIAVVGSLGGHYVLRGFEQARVHDLFARFVPAAVVDEVIARTDKDLRLGAVRRDGTVMFTDLRGFTSFSESLPPERVVQVINQYLGGMTEVILEYGGTLVSFMGDGIFALWGAPLEMDDHADRALAAARVMLEERLPRFNAWLAEGGYDHAFRMGIGLNSGPVMSGQVGSEQRLEYAAIGDTTNTSSRLEGMTKGTPHMLFIAESTRLALHEVPDDLLFVDEFPIRGKQATLKVWSLPDAASSASSASTAPGAPGAPATPAAPGAPTPPPASGEATIPAP